MKVIDENKLKFIEDMYHKVDTIIQSHTQKYRTKSINFTYHGKVVVIDYYMNIFKFDNVAEAVNKYNSI